MDALGLDARVARAAAKRGYAVPTPVQAQAIPLALAGKDVIAQAVTGSGKTAAYLLPALHRLLTQAAEAAPPPRALVLVPTRELCTQVRDEAAALAAAAGGTLRVGQLPPAGAPAAALAAAAAAPPDLLVATPARVAQALREGLFRPGAITRGLQLLVLDEADLLLSFGHEDDIGAVAAKLPRGCQCMLVSATASGPGFERLAGLVLHNPVRCDVAEPVGAAAAVGVLAAGRVSHGLVRCAARDKMLHVLALLRLNAVRRKALIFAPSADAAVRLRLFLERFGVRAATLHGELPANSRAHALAEFNKGLFDFMIATDDTDRRAAARGGADEGDAGGDEEGDDAADPSAAGKDNKKGRKGGKRDAEFGVMRGIDFKDVRTVINMDVPTDVATYVHRVGRTGRAGAAGAALTLASPQEAAALASLDAALAARRAEVGAAGGDEDGDDDVALAAGDGDGADVASDEAPLQVLRPYSGLAASAVEALRYRADDCARACGKAAVREARLRELRAALLQSSRLAAHFEDNPAERRLLQADAPLAKAPAAPHLKHLPAYLRGGAMAPRGAAKKRKRAEAAAAVDAAATGEGAAPAARRRRGDAGGGGVGDDPLKTFSLGLAAKEMAKEGAGGDAPDGDAAAAVARAMWSKGPKSERRRGKAHGGRGGAAGGPEWPVRNSAQMRKGRLNVRRGKRKTSR